MACCSCGNNNLKYKKMDKRFTEGISGDGAVIIDNGRPITITEILDNLNRLDEIEQLLQANVSCSLPSRKKMSSEIKKRIQKKEVMLRDGKNAYCIGFCDGVEYVKRHIQK